MATKMKFGSELKPMSRFSQFGMSDITMLLLMFFLLTSNFAQQNGIPVNIPKAVTGEPSVEKDYVTVTITEQSELYVNDAKVPSDSLMQALKMVQIGKEKMVIRADENAKHGVVIAAASAAAALGMKIAFATEPPDDEPEPSTNNTP